MKNYIQQALNISSSQEFDYLALQLFRIQYDNVEVYRNFVSYLKINPERVKQISDIPFLPISVFKTHKVLAKELSTETVFLSSGTTQINRSRHFIHSLKVYTMSFRKGFNYFYGDVRNYAILALLPSYIEQGQSALVYMVADLIKQSTHPYSGFYLNNYQQLTNTIRLLEEKKQKTILFGVSYALLDLSRLSDWHLKHTIIIETGGMKGRRKEMVKEELHELLKKGFGVSKIHSEYGMTELLSQAYSKEKGIFSTPPWMKVLIRDATDPLSLVSDGTTGGINVIDLANVYSCAFIATQDLGKMYPNNQFEIVGRFDHTDIRGCNLLLY